MNQKSTRKYWLLPLSILIGLGVVALLTSLSIPALAAPATVGILVNSAADDIDADSECTLREAITNANSDAALYGGEGECAAGFGADTINFSGSYTITLGSALPGISTAIIIDGAGQSVAVSGANSYRVFSVSASGSLTVTRLTISEGNAGASSGGGIFNTGTLAVMSSTFSNNRAINGGGIYNFRSATITNIANSTFYSNTASTSGGGIYNYTGTITNVANSTFSGNSASSAGGIFNNGTIITIANTMIASSPAGGNCGGSAPTTSTHNLTDSAGCSTWGWTSTLVPSSHLAPLADNGGATHTIALLGAAATNPAIDAGDASTCSSAPVGGIDQTGFPRPIGAGCDIGAFEARMQIYLPLVIR
jgi:CSLREA domain-containing protein